MSCYSGKCDVFDNVYAGKGNYLQAFDEFKAATGGKIYQHYCIKEVTDSNRDFIAEHCPQFKYEKHVWQDPDKRFKCGYKEIVTYTYEYWGKQYTDEELKRRGGVYVTIEIPIDTALDLVRYLPYIVAAQYWSNGKEVVYIGRESFVDSEFEDMLQYGHINLKSHYDHELAEHYHYVCGLLDHDLGNRTRVERVCTVSKAWEGGPYLLATDPHEKIDYNHPIEWEFEDGKPHTHWASPKYHNEGSIEISPQDFDGYLKDDIENGKAYVRYVVRDW